MKTQQYNVEPGTSIRTAVEKAIMNKIAAKCKAAAVPQKPKGRSVDSLMERLNLLKY